MIVAALILAVALVVSALCVREGLHKVASAFGWTEQTTYTDLDKLLAEKAAAMTEEWGDESDLVLYESSI